ncbi:hypothetical protein LTR91_010641 [Friedmanniomyces endolithicus]|uniref:Nuclear protein DGCR14 n=1 Tax=Friedmanniomyces endolithicus TaxID=329885 RepID=A0AAN6QTB8_9PEZI|nr:hypothetical protein LTR35_015109 [Friedmanniomyces endolithicus]KAK0286475.1 hypothetical protein LTS00_010413 [Friedmanniomyces endolithicus]KAK0317226.1 hypothetical protein LTR82_011827 [Friedmanniomyces endolithicus]KAK0919869.1 hypothetical protein LTR57_010307 [Friedmanniomyces endolithicus]KAK0971037.1 hypothetical protein LTS01_015497 [Friedmanniomyces endolithicus]
MASTAITKRSADNLLMPPPPLPKRQKRPPKVLDEDVYSDALSHIVARDFFPGLLESEAQQEYLSALDSNNNDWIRDAGRKLTQVMTPGPEGRRRRNTSFTPRRSVTAGCGVTPRGFVGATPRSYVGATPVRTPGTEVAGDHFAPERKPDVDVNMSLGAFQAKYTSEDNESFNGLLDKQNTARAAKYAFFHNGNKIPSARQIAHRAREQKLLENGGSGSSSTALITANALGEERLAIAPGRPSQDLDARPASVDSFPNTEGPRNHFMFGPDSVEDHTVTRAQAAEEASLAPPKSVTYAATRFQTGSEAASSSTAVPASPSLSAIDAAISRHPPKPTASEPGYTGAETPRVNGYAFVDEEPTPSELGIPVSDAEADAAEREEVMKLFPDIEEGGPNPFRIDERSKREDLLHRLVEKADVGRRKGGGRLGQLRELGVTPGRTPTPRFRSAPGGGSGMTPAGRMLAAKLGTPKRRVGGFEGREGWATPKG